MCWNNECFNFNSFAGKKVAVIITGPGYLEYPWGFETAIKLKKAGAKVEIIDIANVAYSYSMRIKFKHLLLPIFLRSVLRRILLIADTRIEKVVAKKSAQHEIPFTVKFMKPKILKFRISNIPICNFENVSWGGLNAFVILQNLFSSFEKKPVRKNYLVSSYQIERIKESVVKTYEIAVDLTQENFSAVFLANGRQPVQSTLTATLKRRAVKVYLYESAGGYIFPQVYTKHIDYWLTSPANTIETQEKIKCQFINKNLKNYEKIGFEVLEIIKYRKYIPYSLDYLTIHSSNYILPKNELGKNYVYFASSEWERSDSISSTFFANSKTIFQDQIHAVKILLSCLAENDRLYLRLHPSDPGNVSSEDEIWAEFLCDSRVIIIPTHSRVNSFQIAAQTAACFVWNSFIGIELAVRDYHVGILGDAVYSEFMSGSWLTNTDLLKDWIKQPSQVNISELLPYANYLAKGGFPITNCIISLNREVTIDGMKCDMSKFRLMENYRLINRIR
jgi:hypothetical protein